MREIRYTNRFKRDYQREKAGRHCKKLDVVLMDAVNMLVADVPLPRRYFDHPLAKKSGGPGGSPDFILIFFRGRVPIPITSVRDLFRRLGES
jgi:mRNA interferase YafQ